MEVYKTLRNVVLSTALATVPYICEDGCTQSLSYNVSSVNRQSQPVALVHEKATLEKKI